MRKKLAAVLTAGALCVFALVGCASQESTDAAAPAASSEPVEAVEQETVYVSPEWLNSALAGEQEGYENVVVAQVAYDASADDEGYAKGHIPGAILVSDVEVEDAIGDEEHPYNLLSVEEIEKNALAHGITKDTKVVLYGADPAGVGRVALPYLWLGVEDVKIVNGGLDAWTAAGFETETAENKGEAASDFGAAVPAHPEYVDSIDDVKEKLASDDNFKLVSIRSEQEWLGTTSGYAYMDRAGEPEGAVWGKGCKDPYDMTGTLREDGTVKTLDEMLATEWSDVDFTLDNHLSFYCGTGWRATVPFLIMYQEGYRDISLYDGGWYQWQMDGSNPVQVGDPASDSCEHTTVDKLPTDKAAPKK